jgi:hypothetical protein
MPLEAFLLCDFGTIAHIFQKNNEPRDFSENAIPEFDMDIADRLLPAGLRRTAVSPAHARPAAPGASSRSFQRGRG